MLGFEDNLVLSYIFVDLLFDVRDKTIGELVHVADILEERNDDLVGELAEVLCNQNIVSFQIEQLSQTWKSLSMFNSSSFPLLTKSIGIDVAHGHLVEEKLVCIFGRETWLDPSQRSL